MPYEHRRFFTPQAAGTIHASLWQIYIDMFEIHLKEKDGDWYIYL